MTEPFSISRAISTEEGIYGLILVSGVIATSGAASASTVQTLAFTVVTVLVFWLAHLYAGTVALHGTRQPDGAVMPLRAALARAVKRSRGLLASAVPPAIALLLGAFGVLDEGDAIWLSLWVIVAVLALLGYVAYRRRGARMVFCLLGALATASFGIVIIVAKVVVTH